MKAKIVRKRQYCEPQPTPNNPKRAPQSRMPESTQPTPTPKSRHKKRGGELILIYFENAQNFPLKIVMRVVVHRRSETDMTQKLVEKNGKGVLFNR